MNPMTARAAPTSVTLRMGPSDLLEAVDAGGVHDTDGAALRLQVVEVRQRLTERKAELVAVELATEEHRDDLGRGPRLGDGIQRVGQARGVMRAHLGQALGQPAERQ